eukprot:gb/GFBE01017244.1/.p1 GENE.gb/GFBE01017244.1/~~gb/GFBE01017244.1/.p1  ORF type:complete len:590 (+),score=90.63 gb/GFBE01017244.1/:1-1770(+)
MGAAVSPEGCKQDCCSDTLESGVYAIEENGSTPYSLASPSVTPGEEDKAPASPKDMGTLSPRAAVVAESQWQPQTSSGSCDLQPEQEPDSPVSPGLRADAVRIDREYDFYDPTTRELKVKEARRMLTPRSFDSFSRQTSSDSSASSGGSGSVILPCGRRPSVNSEWSNTTFERGESNRHKESVTRWAVFTAKKMYRSDKKIRAKARSASKEPPQPVRGTKLAVQQANVVVSRMCRLARRIAVQEGEDILDSEWEDPGVLTELFTEDYVDTLMILANGVRRVLELQPPLAQVSVPCRVFGDVHGQLRDLLLLFSAFGGPGIGDQSQVSFVFNGDFVDRGSHQVEVVGLLFALKLAFPDRVWLIRGNHEERTMNERYGFRKESNRSLGKEFGPRIFHLVHKAFNQLPLAAIIANQILVLHGGIGDGKWSLGDVLFVKRPLDDDGIYDPKNKWIFNLLWSDPIVDTAEDGAQGVSDIFGVHPSARASDAVQFGWDVTQTFLAKNGLSLLVRSHQCKRGGTGFDVMHEGTLIGVFSARDYENHCNDGAALFITKAPQGARGRAADTLLVRPQVLRSLTKVERSGSVDVACFLK